MRFHRGLMPGLPVKRVEGEDPHVQRRSTLDFKECTSGPAQRSIRFAGAYSRGGELAIWPKVIGRFFVVFELFCGGIETHHLFHNAVLERWTVRFVGHVI